MQANVANRRSLSHYFYKHLRLAWHHFQGFVPVYMLLLFIFAENANSTAFAGLEEIIKFATFWAGIIFFNSLIFNGLHSQNKNVHSLLLPDFSIHMFRSQLVVSLLISSIVCYFIFSNWQTYIAGVLFTQVASLLLVRHCLRRIEKFAYVALFGAFIFGMSFFSLRLLDASDEVILAQFFQEQITLIEKFALLLSLIFIGLYFLVIRNIKQKLKLPYEHEESSPLALKEVFQRLMNLNNGNTKTKSFKNTLTSITDCLYSAYRVYFNLFMSNTKLSRLLFTRKEVSLGPISILAPLAIFIFFVMYADKISDDIEGDLMRQYYMLVGFQIVFTIASLAKVFIKTHNRAKFLWYIVPSKSHNTYINELTKLYVGYYFSLAFFVVCLHLVLLSILANDMTQLKAEFVEFTLAVPKFILLSVLSLIYERFRKDIAIILIGVLPVYFFIFVYIVNYDDTLKSSLVTLALCLAGFVWYFRTWKQQQLQ